MIITAIEEIGPAWRRLTPRVPLCLKRTLALPAFLPGPARRRARAALAQAAQQLARIEPTRSPPVPRLAQGGDPRPRPEASPSSPGGAA